MVSHPAIGNMPAEILEGRAGTGKTGGTFMCQCQVSALYECSSFIIAIRLVVRFNLIEFAVTDIRKVLKNKLKTRRFLHVHYYESAT